LEPLSCEARDCPQEARYFLRCFHVVSRARRCPWYLNFSVTGEFFSIRTHESWKRLDSITLFFFTVNEFVSFTVLFHVIQLLLRPTTPFGAVYLPFFVALLTLASWTITSTLFASTTTTAFLTTRSVNQNDDDQYRHEYDKSCSNFHLFISYILFLKIRISFLWFYPEHLYQLF
jgi:hypothetical protein